MGEGGDEEPKLSFPLQLVGESPSELEGDLTITSLSLVLHFGPNMIKT
jgi:hypothetical protein